MAEEQPEKSLKIEVTDRDDQSRLDIFLSAQLKDFSRSQIKHLIEDGQVRVNDAVVKASRRLHMRDQIFVDLRIKARKEGIGERQEAFPSDARLSILYEDHDLIVIDKPAGLLVHRGPGDDHVPTLVEVLQQQKFSLSMVNVERPGIVHRLDRDTTGVIVCAKNDKAHNHLARQFAQKSNFRQYLALLDGLMDTAEKSHSSRIGRDLSNRIKMRSWPLDSEMGKLAVSHFTRVKSFAHRFTLVQVQLETGRTHQIRVHAKDIRLPIVGDPVYHSGPLQIPKSFPEELSQKFHALKRQMLHAQYLGFDHPTSGKKMAFEAPLPMDFLTLLADLEVMKD